MRVLVTGIAGFIGAHVAQALLARGDEVVGIDNFNDYYDVSLKRARMKKLVGPKAVVVETDLTDAAAIQQLFKEHAIDAVCHLAAQAGVRYSLENPAVYIDSNVMGTLNIFESARKVGVKKVVYASSSSVYGANTKVPFSVKDRVDSPISLYGATKRTDELMAYVYHHLYGMEMIGLRFFTVYGPWGRPDMALFKFTKAILAGEAIDVYNHGEMERDFTYITDIVSGVLASIDRPLNCEIFNLGNNNPVKLTTFIECIEKALGREAKKNMLPLQPGDVPATFADIDSSQEMLGYVPKTGIQEGIEEFIKWYKQYHNIE